MRPSPPPRTRFRRALLVVLVFAVVGLAVLHTRYPLPYIYRVCVYQDPDFDDIYRSPSRAISSSSSPVDLTVELDPEVVAALEDDPGVGDLDRHLEATETSAFLVLHRGRLVVERYLRGHDRHTPQNTFSVSKSVASALVGLALEDGVVDVDAPITRYLPELSERDPGFSQITVGHLLDMRSGIRFSSAIEFPILNGDNPLIYYHPDLESVLLERLTLAAPPGEFQYVNYNPPLLGLILRRTTGLPVGEYLERNLWQPLGAAEDAGWTTDDRGLERMESGFFARARDLARFGQLYLDGGSVAGRRVLPESWVLESTELAEPAEVESFDGRTWGYRLGWWIVPRPSGRPDFCAIGRYGQFIYVSPQHDVVFVRNGPGRGDWGDGDWTAWFYASAGRLPQRPEPSGESTHQM